jgi:hypothetical protein
MMVIFALLMDVIPIAEYFTILSALMMGIPALLMDVIHPPVYFIIL